MCTYENKVFYAFKTKCLFEDDRIFIENMYDCVRMNKGTEGNKGTDGKILEINKRTRYLQAPNLTRKKPRPDSYTLSTIPVIPGKFGNSMHSQSNNAS